jgi:hypothetical protein
MFKYALTRSDKNRYCMSYIEDLIHSFIKLLTVNNQSLRAKRTYFTLIPRPNDLGYQHHQQQYQFHFSMILLEVCIE